jgi:serine/threonine protein kinase
MAMSAHSATLSATLTCPSCYEVVEASAEAIESRSGTCRACHEPMWLDGKLALRERLGREHPNVFRGLLFRAPAAPDGQRVVEEVVVKVLDVGGLRDWREHDRFRAQREVLDSLAGLPVPRALGDFERGGRVFHCQTLLGGEPLGCARPLDELETIARRLLELLDEIHRRGWIHRDLKPEHLLVDGERRVQLVDFGAARRLADGDGEAEANAEPNVHGSVAPTVIGTPGYMAPEQLLGEARVESDLYAAGKTLAAAHGGRAPHRRMRRLLRALGQPDWRKRPRSAARALRLLDPSSVALTTPPLLAAVSALTLVAVAGVLAFRPRATTSAPALALSDAPQSLPSDGPSPAAALEAEARALHREWEASQNAHDFARYANLYADGFHGTIRSGGRARTLDRAAWLAARAKMFSPTLEVASDALTITVDAPRARATLAFVQRFRAGRFADHGRKELVVERTGEQLRIVDEQMVDSRPGWDEDDYHRRFPAHGATCDIAFDPSEASFLVALGRHDDYRDALRAAGKARRRGTDVEIVWGDDFAPLDSGYWVLSGATRDAEEARLVAARTHGRVLAVSPAGPRFPSVLRFLEERQVDGTTALITVAGETAYVVNGAEALALALDGEVLVERFRVAMPSGARPVRVAVREGHAYVLDENGRWSLIAAGGITPTRAFDPEPEGRVALFGDHRFDLEGDELAYRFREGEAHRSPLLARDVGVWRIGANRLLLFRGTEYSLDRKPNLFLFAVGETPRRLTKVCGAVSGELTAAAHVTIGAIDLDTDREGGFELWSSQWGFYSPTVEASPVCPAVEDSCSTHESSEIDPEVRLLGRALLEVRASASCDMLCTDGC